MSTRKRIPGCLRCQERHVKCDRGKPTCKSCRDLKYPTVCEYASKRLRFRHSRYTSSLAPTTDMTRRESPTVRTPSANSNDLGAISGATDTTHAPPSTFLDYGSHHRSSIDGSGSASTLPAVSPVPSAEDSSPLRVPLTAKPPVPSYCLFPLGLSPVGATPDGYGGPISGSSASVELSHPGVSVDVEQVSPNTTSYHRAPPPSRTLTEEIDCKVFAFYVENAGHWVCVANHRHQPID
jgi:hypothetical protein